MVCLELLKVVAGDKKIEDYRNTFANLALPLFAMAEPIPPKECKYQALKWTLWDRWTLEGDLTVQQVGAQWRMCGEEALEGIADRGGIWPHFPLDTHHVIPLAAGIGLVHGA